MAQARRLGTHRLSALSEHYRTVDQRPASVSVCVRVCVCVCARLNGAEMYVDVQRASDGTATQWIAESGIVDLFLFTGPTPADVARQYATVTGTTSLPQMFSIGYHQVCAVIASTDAVSVSLCACVCVCECVCVGWNTLQTVERAHTTFHCVNPRMRGISRTGYIALHKKNVCVCVSC